MPFPFLLGGAAVVAGLVGTGAAIHGASKMKDAKNTMEDSKNRHEQNLKKFEETNIATSTSMDALGTLELQILDSFKTFSETIEKIQERPDFAKIKIGDTNIPEYDHNNLQDISIGAGLLLGGLGGAALGTAGGFAAAGATTSAVMALGTASTGTAIASLSGVAATNATLAALGGGAIAAGGGGIALGTTLLGAATLGVGLLIGGAIFSFTGSSLSEKADDARAEMLRAEEKINTICVYLNELKSVADDYKITLNKVKNVYSSYMEKLCYIVDDQHIRNWNDFTQEQKTLTENTVLLVRLLYSMCKVKLVIESTTADTTNSINYVAIREARDNANKELVKIS